MSAGPIGELAAALDAGARTSRTRTGNPVHRHSFYAGERELRRWRAANTFSRSENNARMAAAEQFDKSTRRATVGAKNGALGHVALEVYRLLLRLRALKGGRLDPSIKWLATQLDRSCGAIHRAITRLRDNGFLDWSRRTVPVPDAPPGEPQIKQISNAYFLELRDTARAVTSTLVRRILRRPTDAMKRAAEAADRDRRTDAFAAMPDHEKAAAITAGIADPEYAALLTRLALNPDRDSAGGFV